MEKKTIKILLVEDSPTDYHVIKEMLSEFDNINYRVSWARLLSEGHEQLKEDDFDVVLLDLALPDSRGFDTFGAVRHVVPHIPIILLTATDDDELALDLVRRGAQDYLVKGQINSNILVRSIRYSIERHQMHSILRNLALIDELTGLYNRRGLNAIAKQHLKLAQRTKRNIIVICTDMDGLKEINDTCGHLEGDRAIVETAKILKATFRESDIVARYGGDEFVVLAIEAHAESNDILVNRLRSNAAAFNWESDFDFTISLSIGTAVYNPETAAELEDLLREADAAMYEDKRNKI